MAGELGPVKGVLFDLDGVLRNTEPSHRAAYARISKELAGTQEAGEEIAGKSNLQLYERLVERYGGVHTGEELSKRHFELVCRLLDEGGVGPMEGLAELLAGLARRGIPYGVVSSSRRWFVERNLRDLRMDRDAACVVTGEDGLPLKPAPDMYLVGAAALGLPAESLLAVEDSHTGLAAAKAAGLRCAAFHNPDSGVQDLSAADCHITALPQLLPLLDGWNRPERT